MRKEDATVSSRDINNMPAGVTDVLLDDAQLKHHIESSLRELFQSCGYVEAITTNPQLETLFLHMDRSGVGVTLKKR